MKDPAKYHPKATEGKTRLLIPPFPATGKMSRYKPNTIRSNSPSQKFGMDNPNKAVNFPRLSHQVLSLTAEIIPTGIPIPIATIKAPAASCREAGSRAKYSSLTGRLY